MGQNTEPVGGDAGRFEAQDLGQQSRQILVIEAVTLQHFVKTTHRLKQPASDQQLTPAAAATAAEGTGQPALLAGGSEVERQRLRTRIKAGFRPGIGIEFEQDGALRRGHREVVGAAEIPALLPFHPQQP